MTTLPKWSTTQRQAQLVQLFLASGGFCVFGHKNCQVSEHHYSVFIEGLIDDWKADDRDKDRIEWLEERKVMHSLGEHRTPVVGRFNNISMDIYHSNQPLFYLEAMGMDGLRLQPFAKVKIGSSYMRLYVTLGDSLRGVSKNQRRKAIRYGKHLPMSTQNEIHNRISQAVKDYLTH